MTRSRNRAQLRMGVVGVLLLLAPSAWAADKATTERIDGIRTDLDVLQGSVTSMKDNFTQRRGLIGVSDARKRYEDALYSYMVHDWEGAATSFYILVQSNALGTDALARDAEWYLAESLFELGNYKTALEAYQGIIDKPNHPYTPDAVRRCLEVLGLIGDTVRFDKFYNDYIVSGKVPATDVVNYTLGKSFYRRGDRMRSKSLFEAIPATSPWYSRARFFVGAMMIEEHNNTAAAAEFQKVVSAQAPDDDRKQVLEEGEMALGRLAYETGHFEDSANWFAKIPAESPRYNEALYESLWTHIKQSQWDEARSEASAYLARNPDDRRSEALELLLGHLYLKTRNWDQAVAAYQKVAEDFGGVAANVDEVTRSSTGTRHFLEQMEDGKGTGGVPRFAMEMLLDDDVTHRATDAYLSVGQQRRAIADCRQMIGELKKTIDQPDRELGGFLTARGQIDGMRGSVIRLYGRLIDAEATWLKTKVDPAGRDEINAVVSAKDDLGMKLFASNGDASTEGKRSQLLAQYNPLRERLRKLRNQMGDADAATTGTEFDALWSRALATDQDAADARTLVDKGSAREIDAVKQRLAATEGRVNELAEAVDGAEQRTEVVAEKALAVGLHRIHDQIADDVLAADKGVVDVYWIQKTESGDDSEGYAADQAEAFQALDTRYSILKQGLEE